MDKFSRTCVVAALMAIPILAISQENPNYTPQTNPTYQPNEIYQRPGIQPAEPIYVVPPDYMPDETNPDIYQEPVYDVRYRVTRVDDPTLTEILAAWTGKPRETADKMIAKYGQPNEATNGRLVWLNNGVWKITVVENTEIAHDWPVPHTDLLYQAIEYAVPTDKFDDLASFDGSVLPERTRGWLGARCDKEEANFLAVNLANDIIKNKRSVSGAREFYAKTVDAMMASNMNDEQTRYTSGFTFDKSSKMQGDRDKPAKGGYGGSASYDSSNSYDANMSDQDQGYYSKNEEQNDRDIHDVHKYPSKEHRAGHWDRHWDAGWKWSPHTWGDW